MIDEANMERIRGRIARLVAEGKIAQRIEARSDETAQPVQPEGQEPDPQGCAQGDVA